MVTADRNPDTPDRSRHPTSLADVAARRRKPGSADCRSGPAETREKKRRRRRWRRRSEGEAAGSGWGEEGSERAREKMRRERRKRGRWTRRVGRGWERRRAAVERRKTGVERSGCHMRKPSHRFRTAVSGDIGRRWGGGFLVWGDFKEGFWRDLGVLLDGLSCVFRSIKWVIKSRFFL